jgi:hypothetical protein
LLTRIATQLNPTSCFFAILGGKFYHFRIVAHDISIGYISRRQM